MFARLLTGTLLLSLLVCGCNNSGMGPQGQVSGKVIYNGKPLPGGQVTFLTAKGYTFNSVIDPEGNYKLQAPVGEAKIVVDNRMLLKSNEPPKLDLRHPPGITPPPGVKQDDAGASSAPAIAGTYVALPKKYSSPDASGLTYTVKSGTQTYDIDLSDKP
jgi:hypothetical protein